MDMSEIEYIFYYKHGRSKDKVRRKKYNSILLLH